MLVLSTDDGVAADKNGCGILVSRPRFHTLLEQLVAEHAPSNL